jgi:sulfur-oxidizing protein SoxY
MRRLALLIACAPLAAAAAAPLAAVAAETPRVALDDPFRTGMLAHHQIGLLGDPARIAFDPRVKVVAPQSAEDSLHVPVTVDATAVPDVKRIVMFVDYGPIPQILEYRPTGAEARLSFRFKIDQASPIRAAVETADGSWLLGGAPIDAAGGGCTAPAAAYALADWSETLGEVRARVWPEAGRVGLRIDHPMDTGLADGIPVFIIERLALAGADGAALAEIVLHEPVEEDPTFTLHVDPAHLVGPLRLTGRDNNGNEIDAEIPVPDLTQ